MAKQEIQETEYNWDSGTYQTGATKPNKGQSAVITALLIAVIFLGGLASALGLMNIRLLSTLMKQQQDPVLPISVDSNQGSVNDFFRENQDQLPVLPVEGDLKLTLGDSGEILSSQQIMEYNSQSVLTLTVQTGQNQHRTGPALVLSSDGYLLTNAHLTDNASNITVHLQNGEQLRAALVATDAYSDIAVLYVGVHGLTPAVFAGNEGEIAPGHQAYTLMQSDVISQGNVLEESRQLMVGQQYIQWLKTDLDGDHGPVFNEQGQLSGFLCRYFGEETGGYLISATQLMQIVQELAEQGVVSGRPSLGLEVEQTSNFCRRYWGLSGGLQITQIFSDAEQTRLLEGDILLYMDGMELTTRQQFYDLLLAKGSGSVTLEVFRAGQRFTIAMPVCQWS